MLSLIERYDDAVDCCHSALKFYPRNDSVLKTKAQILNRSQRYEEALDLCNDILKVNPDCEDAWIERGNACEELSKYEEAVSSFENAFNINSENEITLIGIESVLVSLKRYEEAIKYADKELELSYSMDSLCNAYTTKSISLYFLDRYEESIHNCDKALEIDSSSESTYLLKGNCLLCINKFEEAVDCFSQLLIINPKSEDIWFKKSFAHFMLGDKKEAAKCLDKCLEINPEDTDSLYFKAEILKTIGKLDESLNCYKTLAQIDPNFKDKNGLSVADCIYKLQELVLKNKIKADIKKTNIDQIKTEVAEQKVFYGSATEKESNTEEIYTVNKEIYEQLKRDILKDLINEMNSQITTIIQQSIRPIIQNQQIIVQNQNFHHRKVMENHNFIIRNQQIILENVRIFGNELANLKNEFKNCNSEDIISLIENKMDEFTSKAQKENKKDYEKYIEAASKAIANWGKLNENTKEYLAMAEYLYSSLSELSDHERRDYSPIVLEICRSFENELKDKIFYNFIQYACSNFDDVDSFEYDLNPNAEKLLDALSKQKRDQKAHLTLREMCNILDCVRSETDAMKQTELIKTFRKYVKDRFDLNRIIDDKFLRDIEEICNYRNESAHVDKLSKDNADEVKNKGYTLINDLIESKKR